MAGVAAPTAAPAGPNGTLTPAQQASINAGSVAQAAKNNAAAAATQLSTNDSGVQNPNGSGDLPVVNPNQSLMVTSSASRATTSDNVNSMNTALSGVTGKPSVVANTGGGTTTTAATPGTDVFGNPIADTGVNALRVSGGTYTGSDGNLYYNYDGTSAANAPAQTTTAAPASGTGTGSNGTGTTTAPATGDGTSTAATYATLDNGTQVATTGLDPATASQFVSNINNQNSAAATALAQLNSAKATYANDPAMANALSTISAQYDTLIQNMQLKNNQLVGRASTAVAAFGGLGTMAQSFMTDEMSAASARIGDLQTQEADLLLKTQLAYQAGDLKALNDAQTAADNANTAAFKAVSDLLTATNNQVKADQAQQKIDAANAKALNTQDLSNSVKNAAGALSLLTSSYGVTDPSQATPDQLNSIAAAFGVSNPAIIQAQMVSAYATAQKTSLAAANTQSEIDTRQTNAQTAINRLNKSSRPTVAATTANEISGINKLLTQADANGTPYIDQSTLSQNGGNGYFTVAGFKTLINNTSLTRAAFIKQYASYFSPDGYANYGLTPAEIASIKNIGKTAAATA